MSKSKPKDKKNDNSSVIQAQYQAQKRQYLDLKFTLKKYQEKINMTTQQNKMLVDQYTALRATFQEKMQQMTIRNETNEKWIITLSRDKTQLQLQKNQYQSKISILQSERTQMQIAHQKEVQQLRKNMNFEIGKLDSQLMEHKQYMAEKEQLQADRSNLREMIQLEKAQRVREIADKQREKVQAIDKLRDEMRKKNRQMQRNLQSLKKQQLDTTTRLTILQNHQLTSQLQYQSKQTQKLIFKNQEMQVKIHTLQRDLQIHKQVEDQLAKRSHVSKGIIKRLNARIAELEQQIEQLKKSHITGLQMQRVTETKNKHSQITQMLQSSLETSEKKYLEMCHRYEKILQEKDQCQAKLQKYSSQSNNLANLLRNYYSSLVQDGKIMQISQENQLLQLDIEKLRSSPVQEWANQEVSLVVRLLLSALKPLLTLKNIPIPFIRKNLIISDSQTKLSNALLLKKIQAKQKTEQGKHNMTVPCQLSQGKNMTFSEREKQNFHGHHTKRIQQFPVSVATKIVSSNLREWGQSVKAHKKQEKSPIFNWKYKLQNSQR